MVFQWKSGFRANVSAEVAGKVCQELEEQESLTAENLVQVSTPEDAPLHKCFNWNNEEAANLYREHQARNLINHLVIVRAEDDDEDSLPISVPVKVYHALPEDEGNYSDIRTILINAEKTDSLLEMAKTDWTRFKTKYQQIKKLSDAIQAMDSAISEL